MLSDIPADLRSYAQWIVWRYEARDQTETKVPYDAKTGGLAAVDNAVTWCTFEEACAALGSGQYSGLGFVLTSTDPFTFIDLDIKGEISDSDMSRQIRIQEAFNTYSERSPGGKGLHILCKGHVPRGRKRSGIEIYSSLRYMTVTGEVYDRKPIEERQGLVELLWSEMGVGTPIYDTATDAPQTIDDAEVYRRASSAANGTKFLDLWNGNWQTYYPAQAAAGQGPSEADFALIDMLAFYTQNREQIVRLFRMSFLGQRPKAQRVDYVDMMVNRSFDRMLPSINVDSLKAHFDEYVTGQRINGNGAMLGSVAPPLAGSVPNGGGTPLQGVTIPHVQAPQHAVKFPPGLMGDIAQFIFSASQRPVAEVALASAIGLMAGTCGRAYNTPTSAGLNLYTLLIALSGIGKEQMASGISRLTEAVAKLNPGSGELKVPSVREFIGPSEIRSDAALIKQMEKSPCFVSILGEFGMKLAQMHHPNANAHMKGLKSVFLDLYGKSGKGNMYRPMVYSDSAKNTHSVEAPSFSILAESTPSTFYEALDESLIAQGLLSRFLIIEYFGLRPPSNEAHALVVPPQLLQHQYGQLAAYCHTMMNSGRTIQVQYADQQTYEMAKAFDKFCDSQINASDRDAIRDLWNRGHLKVLKLASLVAVGLDFHAPLIRPDLWAWAQELVETDIRRLLKRFEKGDIGHQDNNEGKQQQEVLRIMRDFLFKPWAEIEKYKCGVPAMQTSRVVPHSYIVKRLVSNAAFKRERMGAGNAINRTIKQMMESGIIAEVTAKVKFDIGGKSYMIADLRHVQDDE